MDAESESRYEVALSFAGEQRPYVEQVAITLQSRGISVFYDDFETVRLWGKHLTEELPAIYELRAGLVVIFISKTYVEKAWPRHERRSSFSRAARESREYVLPVRFDDTEVPGLSQDVFYLQAGDYSPAELAAMIAEKIGVQPFGGKASEVPPPRMASLVGEAVFDYSNHNGLYVIGRGSLQFETKWAKADNRSIHVVNYPPSINGIALGRREWTTIDQVVDAQRLDYTSHARTPCLGQIVIFRNVHGFYAAAHLLKVKDDSRGDKSDELRFQYAIQPNGSDNFTGL